CRVELEARGLTEEEARQALGRLRPAFSHGADSLRLRVGPSGGPDGRSGRGEIRLGVPEGTDLRVVARDGSVRVEDVRGSVAVRTPNGRIEGEGARGPIVLESSNGSIECEAHDALVSALTSNGSITFRGSLAPGTSRMVTENGPVT